MVLRYKEDWNDCEFCYQVTPKEVSFIRNLTPNQLYQHMRQCIGKMTMRGASKLIPQLICDNIRISVQINYQLWNLRGADIFYRDDTPITEEEFDELVPKSCNRLIDVRVQYGDNLLIPPTQMTINQFVLELQDLLQEE